MSEWLGPEDDWPRHPKPFFRDALEMARARGWSFRKSEGHGFGVVLCDPTLPPEKRGGCQFPVYSTGSAGEFAAGRLVKLLERCPHHDKGPAGLLQVITTRLQRVQLLVDTVRQCLATGRDEERMAGLLLAAEESVDDVDRLVDEAVEAERVRDEGLSSIRIMVGDAGIEDVGPREAVADPSPLLDVADSELTSATTAVAEMSGGSTRRRLRDQCRQHREEIAALRAQLTSP